MAFAKTLKECKLSFYCDFCFKDITLNKYFRCEDCFFDICIECFACRYETEQHKSQHSFRVISNLTKPLIHDDWRLVDELFLIEGLVSYGFDNFDDISLILSPKQPADVRRHFYDLIGITDDERGEVYNLGKIKSNPNDSFVLSFMSKRKEFDSEILNDYENTIETLRFEPQDTIDEAKYKKHMLYNYKNVLKRRKIWRNFILNRNLVDMKALKEKDSMDIGIFTNKYKWLAQFLSKNDFNTFISSLKKEIDLKNKIANFPILSMIDESRLSDNKKLINRKEEKLCEYLNLEISVYVKLKKMVLEFFVSKKPLRDNLKDLFAPEDSDRAAILYEWFRAQKVVFE